LIQQNLKELNRTFVGFLDNILLYQPGHVNSQIHYLSQQITSGARSDEFDCHSNKDKNHEDDKTYQIFRTDSIDVETPFCI